MKLKLLCPSISLKKIYKIKKFLIRTITHFINTGCSYRAAALAFSSILSLVPLLTVIFAVLTVFPEFKKFSYQIETFIFDHFVAATGSLAQQYFHEFVNNALQLSAIGSLFLIIAAISMMLTIEETFNAIWKIKKQRKFISAVLLYWSALTLLPLLIGTGLSLTSAMAALPFITSAAPIVFLKKILLIIIPFILSFAAFIILYTAVPYCTISFHAAFYGALLTTLLFEAAKNIFSWYIKDFGSYQALYGTLAAIPTFLLWIYLCWIITLLGAVLTYVLQHSKEEEINFHETQ